MLLLLLGGGLVLWRRAESPQPPAVPLRGADPEVAKAITEAEERVGRYPDSGHDWGYLGMTLYVHGFQSQAAVCFGRAQALEPREPRWPYFRGLCLLEQNGDPRAALPDLQQAAALAGDVPDAPRLLLAETLLNQGRPNEAEPLLRQALQHDPNNARALLGLGRVALAQGHLAQAHDALLQSYRTAPNVKATQLLLAQLFRRQGNSQMSDALARQAARLPDQADWADPFSDEASRLKVGKIAQIQRGEVLVITGRFDAAVAQMAQTVRQYPDSGRAWMLLGAGYVGLGNLAEGENDLRKAVALNPKSAESCNHLGDALARQGRNQEAMRFFRQALAINPQSAEFHVNLAVCFFRLQDMPNALKEFNTAVQLDPDSIRGRAGLAETLAQEHQTAAALQQLQAALKLNPHDPVVLESLARLRGSAATHQQRR